MSAKPNEIMFIIPGQESQDKISVLSDPVVNEVYNAFAALYQLIANIERLSRAGGLSQGTAMTGPGLRYSFRSGLEKAIEASSGGEAVSVSSMEYYMFSPEQHLTRDYLTSARPEVNLFMFTPTDIPSSSGYRELYEMLIKAAGDPTHCLELVDPRDEISSYVFSDFELITEPGFMAVQNIGLKMNVLLPSARQVQVRFRFTAKTSFFHIPYALDMPLTCAKLNSPPAEYDDEGKLFFTWETWQQFTWAIDKNSWQHFNSDKEDLDQFVSPVRGNDFHLAPHSFFQKGEVNRTIPFCNTLFQILLIMAERCDNPHSLMEPFFRFLGDTRQRYISMDSSDVSAADIYYDNVNALALDSII